MMSVEALGPERHSNEEIVWGVEMAVEAISRVRLLLNEQAQRLELELAAEVTDLEVVKYIKARIKELESQLKDNLAFLKEFDPKLYAELKEQ
jgi:hypothetical protein